MIFSFKIRKSGFKGTEDQLKQYCREVNQKMGFFDIHTELKPDLIEDDSDGKTFYKLVMNSLLGKWGQVRDLPHFYILYN